MKVQTPISQLNVVVIGFGNLAYSLVYAILNSTHKLLEVSSRNQVNSTQIATLTGAKYVSNIEDITPNADVYLLAVPDSAISDVIKRMPKTQGIIAHTSGSTPLETISKYSNNRCGVFYPFQTFTFGRVTQFEGIPVCIEATDEDTFNILSSLASSLGAFPVEMDTEMRKWLHLSGVFACNFVNHMLALSHMLALENELDPSLLKPLILETIKKALEGSPADCQTGPAVRGDTETLKRHYAMLNQVDEDMRDLYGALSASIQRLHQK
jgi:predicted short-subunit dehydrogenase-like oxidoreductase (DUF2520 family)